VKIAFDIDGVLADVRPFVKKYLIEKKDWNEYFKHTLEFPVIKPCFTLLKQLNSIIGNEIFIVTGRPESNRILTAQWFLTNGILATPRNLIMRPSNCDEDMRNCDFKLAYFRIWKPNLIIDDDSDVIEGARELDIETLQVVGYRMTHKDMIPFKEPKI
jgi:hypothetical protein